MFINAGKGSFHQNGNLSQTCSFVFSLFTIDHFPLIHFLHSVRGIQNNLFGQDDRLHNLNIK